VGPRMETRSVADSYGLAMDPPAVRSALRNGVQTMLGHAQGATMWLASQIAQRALDFFARRPGSWLI